MKQTILTLLLMLLPMMASADAVEIDGIYYKLDNEAKTAELTYNPNRYSGSVVIPEKVKHEETEYSVTSIGYQAFYNCRDLTSVNIPGSLRSIGDHAFYYCSSLTAVYISDLEAWCKIIFGGYYNNPLYFAHHLFLSGKEIKDLVIPNSVTSIGEWAFYGCSGLTSVTIPNSVTSIGIGAFENCSGLTSVTIPNGVTTIGDRAFSGCSGLTSVTIPNSVTSIGGSAFADCSGLASVTIPNSVTTIGDSAFSGCSGLTSVTIGNSVSSIFYGAFAECNELTSVHISDLEAWCKINFIDSYGEYDSNPLSKAHHLYLNGEEIKDLIIPNSVTFIGDRAFYGCSGLTSVTIPNSVTYIGQFTFYNCTNLMSVTSNITEPYSINYNVFSTETYRQGTLYIPAGTEKLYTRFDGWREFLNIMEIGSVSNIRGDLNNDGKVDAADVVELVNIIMNK